MSSDQVNLSFYYFTPLGTPEDLARLRPELKAFCAQREIVGTILIAHEGFNGMLSGPRSSILEFKEMHQNRWNTPESVFKITEIEIPSFNRLLVKIKKELIPVGDPELQPNIKTANRVSAEELKKWLDENKDIVLLDTRNDYEIEVGTFENAVDWGLTISRDFAKKAEENLENLKGKTIVTFCTGGIRCEKASAYLLKLGLKDVYQLDGGIIRYFEKNGSDHFRGNCFVFDWRIAVDGNLKPIPRSAETYRAYGRHRPKW